MHSPRAMMYVLASLFTLAIAADLLWMPIQVSDSLGEIMDAARSPSIWASFTGSFGTEEYLRPMRIAQIKALFDIAPAEHYWVAYRGFHVVLLVAAVMLFTRALRVSRTPTSPPRRFRWWSSRGCTPFAAPSRKRSRSTTSSRWRSPVC